MNHCIITFDVAIRQRKCTTVAICKAPDRSILFVIIKQVCNTNPNQGEAEAMLSCMQEAKANQIGNIVVARDSLNTLKAVQDSNYIQPCNLLFRILRLLSKTFTNGNYKKYVEIKIDTRILLCSGLLPNLYLEIFH